MIEVDNPLVFLAPIGALSRGRKPAGALSESRSLHRLIGLLNTSNEGVRFHPLAATKNLSSALLHLRQYPSFLRPNGDTGGVFERVMFPVRDTDAKDPKALQKSYCGRRG